MEKLNIEDLGKLLKSSIVKDFKYYVCPINRFYNSCIQVDKVYDAILKKYGKGKKVSYSEVAREIENAKPCEDIIVCPLMVPNFFERVLNLNNALKTRKLGEIKFTTSDNIEIL
jgi:hypothetical protein